MQRTEPLPDLLVKMVMVPMEALIVLNHLHLIFFQTEVTCEGTFQMQGCMASTMSRFITDFLKCPPET